MQITIDMLDGSGLPKRGDLIQTNIGDRRERTAIILRVHKLRPTRGVPRCKIWAERWWQVEPDLRLRLFQSAERNGGQGVIRFRRYKPVKRKKTFEAWMRRGLEE